MPVLSGGLDRGGGARPGTAHEQARRSVPTGQVDIVSPRGKWTLHPPSSAPLEAASSAAANRAGGSPNDLPSVCRLHATAAVHS